MPRPLSILQSISAISSVKMRSLTSPAASAAVYIGCSLFASLLGKVVVTRFFFDYPIVILLLQNATVLFLIEVLRVSSVLKMSAYSFEKGRHAFLPSLLLCVAQWLTVASFEGIGLPAFDAVKRLAPAFVLVAGCVLNRQRLDRRHVIAVGAVTVISFLTVNLELSLDRFSVFYGLVAAVLQAVAYVQFEQLSQTFQASELLYLHSFNSLIVFLIADIVQDEVRDAFMYMMTSSHPLFAAVFLLLLIAAIPLQYSTFLCLQHNGALNTQIASNIRACVQIFVAYSFSLYLFYDVSPGLLNYLGLLASLPVAYYYFLSSRHEVSSNIPWTTKA